MKRWTSAAVLIWLTLSTGCLTINTGLPPHCKTRDEVIYSGQLRREKVAAFKPQKVDEGFYVATRYKVLQDRIDYLEARCFATNRLRGEK